MNHNPNPVSPNTPTQNKITNLNICSLNCRSFSKPSALDLSRSFSRFLSSSDMDILCLQETHSADPEVQIRLDMQLQAKASIWTHYCGVVSLNPAIQLNTVYVSADGRVVLCKVSHANHLFPSFRLMNIYAPATPYARYDFYADLLQLPYFHTLLSNLSSHSPTFPPEAPAMVVGDFNYNFRHFPSTIIHNKLQDPEFITNLHLHYPHSVGTVSSTPEDPSITPILDSNEPSSHMPPATRRAQWLWHAILQQHYQKSSHRLQPDPPVPTYTSGPYRLSQWTDHAILTLHFQLRNTNHGRGLWRANPRLAANRFFVNQLHAQLDEFHQQLASRPVPPSPQLIWDDIKSLTRTLAQRIGRKQAEWRRRQLQHLQKKRSRILRTYKSTAILNDRLPDIEASISTLQQEIAANQALRSGLRWREKGETSAGFLKRLTTQRPTQRTLPTLVDPSSGTAYVSQAEKEQAVHSFYSNLYTPETVNHNEIQFFANMIPPTHRLSDDSHESLCSPFTLDDILVGLSRSPNHSSPGTDGLPYQIVHLLFSHPATAACGLRVFNDALLHGIFPASWTQTSLVLLPKKGDPSYLKNWRPISLINTDAKTFTRLINARLMIHLSDKISIQQMGFMPHRFIAEQGLQVQCMQTVATISKTPSIALLLDQEKAYDRIHFAYLEAIMQAFNIPTTLITAILNLFSTTLIQPNVNGFLSSPLQQLRGLRQGDPLSPLLFNIAFDPLLRAVNVDPRIHGFSFPPDPSNGAAPPPVKILAYADDTLVALNSPSEFPALEEILQRYTDASNASLNYNKTQALSLSGRTYLHWIQFLASKGITSWHDNTSSTSLTYLGYGLFSNLQQRSSFIDNLISTIRTSCQLHSARNLTLRGRVTVLNSLILSKLWHVLRLVTFLPFEFASIQSIISSFVNRNAKITRLSFDTLTLPRSQGGLKLLDPAQQANALQWRWLHPLLHPDQPSPPLMPSLPVLRSTLSLSLGSTRFPSYHWSLLFPPCRPTGLPGSGSVFNIIRAVDSIQRNFNLCFVSIPTILRLPFLSLLHHSLPPSNPLTPLFSPPSIILKNHHTIRLHLYGTDIFDYNPTTLNLELKQTFRNLPHPTSSSRAVHMIRSNSLLLNTFTLQAMIRHCPRSLLTASQLDHNTPPSLDSLHSLLTSIVSSHLDLESYQFQMVTSSTKGFKSLPSSFPPKTPSVFLPPSKWKTFWSLRIPLNARNIWFRVLHGKIATRELLQRRLKVPPAPTCSICRSSMETTEHFLFACPVKRSFWTTAFQLYMPPSINQNSYSNFRKFLLLKHPSSR
ncbi:conserved hypothetical protein [Mucor ambiguus]|uniref:Reverse transcriptase domain-containing protein n=1 Tax=Mucor ambiguus TaxID=91626 RepID=A0A0C9M987_9FUNG|nr:conserved hypothetical protein [Mucor ambiguus]